MSRSGGVARSMDGVAMALAVAAAIALGAADAGAGSSWPGRSNDLQNTGNAGYEPAFQVWTVTDLKVIETIDTEGMVNATPVVSDGLLIVGDWKGFIYVVDLETYTRLLQVDTGSGGNVDLENFSELGNYVGIQSTGVVAEVTLPDGSEEKRAYVGANSARTLWCVNLTKVLAHREALRASPADPGGEYLCDSPTGDLWPRSLQVTGEPKTTFNGAPKFSKDQAICLADCATENRQIATRDILYTPSTGLDCADGQFWAMDAYTGQIYWTFDPVVNGNGQGGVIWTTPAMNRDRSLVYVTTGNCVSKPQFGEKAESLVALDAVSGRVVWHHQRRLIDTADLDIGNGVLVADVPDAFETPGCNVVVSSDKDGCIYAFGQQPDIAQVGELGFDPLRMGQQRLLWRQCFVPGSLNGGFNASNMALEGRLAMQQWSGFPVPHVGGDDANAFGVDVCTGVVAWATSDVSNGRTDAAAASGYFFQLGVTRRTSAGSGATEIEAVPYPYEFVREIQVVGPDSDVSAFPPLLATIDLGAVGQPSLGGGGLAIANGRIYVPTSEGIGVVGVVRGSGASQPRVRGRQVFAGPYPHPIAPNLGALDYPHVPGAGNSLPPDPEAVLSGVLSEAKDPYPLTPLPVEKLRDSTINYLGIQ